MIRRPVNVVGAMGGCTRGDQYVQSTAHRRSFYQQQQRGGGGGGSERRLPDAPSDGVIRSSSLQHPVASQLSNHHHIINRSVSTGGVADSPSKTSNGIRSLKKTVRFDAEDDEATDEASTEPSDTGWMTLASCSKDGAGWDWLMGRQESRESAARDSGVETLTSGEGDTITPYDHKSDKVNKQERGIKNGRKQQQKKMKKIKGCYTTVARLCYR